MKLDEQKHTMFYQFFLHRAAFCLALFSVLLVLILSLAGCGYRNPYVSNDENKTPWKTLHITTWENRTNELGLESIYFRMFNAWFKNSSKINVIQDRDQADLCLNGEIVAIDLPGLFYDKFDEALEIKIKLTVRFDLRDNSNDHILWRERNFTLYEPFIIDLSPGKTKSNKRKALVQIGNEIAELIYLRTHEIVKTLQ
jgi:hypothetical protein